MQVFHLQIWVGKVESCKSELLKEQFDSQTNFELIKTVLNWKQKNI